MARFIPTIIAFLLIAGVALASDPFLHRQLRELEKSGIQTLLPAAVYVDEKLSSREQKSFDSRAVRFLPTYVPAVPGRHPHGFHLAEISSSGYQSLKNHQAVRGVYSLAGLNQPQDDLARIATNSDVLTTSSPLAQNYDGSGVRIAILDSGFDLTHPDYPVPLEQYDMTTGEDIDSWETNVGSPVDGHGTHVAGAALGRGVLNWNYRGTAPGADFLAYKIGRDSDAQATDADLIEAVMRAVDAGADILSLSYGGLSVYLDGSGPNAQAFDAAHAAGVVCFAAAGNDGGNGHHGSIEAAPGDSTTTGSLEYIINNNSNQQLTNPQILQVVWRDDQPGDFNIELECANCRPGESFVSNDTEDFAGVSNRGTEVRLVEVIPDIEPRGNFRYEVIVRNKADTGETPKVHIYTLSLGGFSPRDNGYTVISPALADTVIAVGAWGHRQTYIDWTGTEQSSGEVQDAVANFSSRGPRIDGYEKPQIVAPGAALVSLRSQNAVTSRRMIDNDGLNLNGSGPADYYAVNGTSMATPHVAGIAALMLQANPYTTAAEIRAALESSASLTSYTPEAGYGLVDAVDAIQLTGESSAHGWMLIGESPTSQ